MNDKKSIKKSNNMDTSNVKSDKTLDTDIFDDTKINTYVDDLYQPKSYDDDLDDKDLEEDWDIDRVAWEDTRFAELLGFAAVILSICGGIALIIWARSL
jgi:hypothetical protein